MDLNGLQVADLFAGTGALGIEALSRGAGSVTFVENDAAAFASISANLASTGLEGRKAVLKRRDVLDFVRSPEPRSTWCFATPLTASSFGTS